MLSFRDVKIYKKNFLVPIIYTNTLRHYTPYKPFISFRRSKKWV